MKLCILQTFNEAASGLTLSSSDKRSSGSSMSSTLFFAFAKERGIEDPTSKSGFDAFISFKTIPGTTLAFSSSVRLTFSSVTEEKPASFKFDRIFGEEERINTFPEGFKTRWTSERMSTERSEENGGQGPIKATSNLEEGWDDCCNMWEDSVATLPLSPTLC